MKAIVRLEIATLTPTGQNAGPIAKTLPICAGMPRFVGSYAFGAGGHFDKIAVDNCRSVELAICQIVNNIDQSALVLAILAARASSAAFSLAV